ncbi:MAG: hypothetical protein ACOYWZ_02565, partial [Bacillota bacterium]
MIVWTRIFGRVILRLYFVYLNFRLGKRKYISLLIDATTLKDDFWILSASISFCGRAIPVYLKIWTGVNTSYDYWDRVKEFLKGL